jgi:hypothetical protein
MCETCVGKKKKNIKKVSKKKEEKEKDTSFTYQVAPWVWPPGLPRV